MFGPLCVNDVRGRWPVGSYDSNTPHHTTHSEWLYCNMPTSQDVVSVHYHWSRPIAFIQTWFVPCGIAEWIACQDRSLFAM